MRERLVPQARPDDDTAVSKHNSFEENEGINLNYSFFHEGVEWHVVVGDLSNGFKVRLGAKGLPDLIVLDYQYDDMSSARLHLSPGQNATDPLPVRMGRLVTWTKAIQTYDALMAESDRTPDQGEDLKTLLQSQKIPRLKVVELPTTSENLKPFLHMIGAVNRGLPGENAIPWSNLVDFARRQKPGKSSE
jgi:hypothetical protein